MNKVAAVVLGALLLAGGSWSGTAGAQEQNISGKWTGTCVNDFGVQSADALEITVNEDGTLSGTMSGMKIVNGERVTVDVLQWECATETHRWRVRCAVRGKSLVLDYTCTWKDGGTVKGGTGISVLTKQTPVAQGQEPQAALTGGYTTVGVPPEVFVVRHEKGVLIVDVATVVYIPVIHQVTETIEGKTVTKKITVYKTEVKQEQRQMKFEGVSGSTADGKPLDADTLARRLTKPTVVFISRDGQPLSPAFRAALKDDAIILWWPKPERADPPPPPPPPPNDTKPSE